MTLADLNESKEAIAEICRKYGVEELSILGSALRDDFGPDSDVDFLVTIKDDDYGPWMSKLTGMEEELTRLLGRKADIVPRKDLKWAIRDRVLASAKVIYVAV